MSGREEKARKGYWNGGQAPYGYRLVDRGGKFKELVVDEDEAKVVRKIFQMYAYENKGAMAIASWLNRHGVTKAARGNATMETFGNTTIARMVVNPVYIGKIAYGRRRTEVIEGTRGETHVVKSDGYEVCSCARSAGTRCPRTRTGERSRRTVRGERPPTRTTARTRRRRVGRRAPSAASTRRSTWMPRS